MVTDKSINSLINRLGLSFEIKENDTVLNRFKAVLQPLRYKNKIYLEGVPTELGYDNLKKYLLISLPEIDLSVLDNLSLALYSGDTHYSIDHTEKVYFKGKAFYTWSIVSKEE